MNRIFLLCICLLMLTPTIVFAQSVVTVTPGYSIASDLKINAFLEAYKDKKIQYVELITYWGAHDGWFIAADSISKFELVDPNILRIFASNELYILFPDDSIEKKTTTGGYYEFNGINRPEYKPNPIKFVTVNTGGGSGGNSNGEGGGGGLLDAIPVLGDILAFIKDLPSKLLDGIYNLFVPDENFISSKFNNVKQSFMEQVGFEAYMAAFTDLINTPKGEFTDIKMDGYRVGVGNNSIKINSIPVVDSKPINDYLPTVHGWVRGFCFILLAFSVINDIYRLIRGTSLYGVSQTAKNMEKS